MQTVCCRKQGAKVSEIGDREEMETEQDTCRAVWVLKSRQGGRPRGRVFLCQKKQTGKRRDEPNPAGYYEMMVVRLHLVGRWRHFFPPCVDRGLGGGHNLSPHSGIPVWLGITSHFSYHPSSQCG